MGEEYNYLFKVILVGDSGVGKSSILNRFTKNTFNTDSKATIGVEFSTKSMQCFDKVIRAQIWDTAGQERFRAVTQTYYKGAFGALLVFDVSKPKTLEGLANWIKEMRTHGESDLVILLIGNKKDLRATDLAEQVRVEDAEEFAKKNGLMYVETSAKENLDVEKAFDTLVKEIYQQKKASGELDDDDEAISVPKPQKANIKLQPVSAAPPPVEQKKSGCC
eukprot:TRINITY_DN8107_c0_g1_i2.p1 TRINITY_DN8107_c0_g1~~TRINITY_DN8107_c0_g1_i2.p1  ORF type:complete len:220 (+),score=58.43 TRINITY_DN8107_c0_g1_i2:74-733(+)